MAKHPRRLLNFYIQDTGQLSFIVLFATLSSLFAAASILAYVAVVDLTSDADLVELDSIEAETGVEAETATETDAEATDLTEETATDEDGDELADSQTETAVEGGDDARVIDVSNAGPWGDLCRTLWPIVVIALVNFVVLVGMGLVLSHRLFGPIYRLRTFVDELAEGRYERRVHLRGHDSFQTLATALNRLADHLAAGHGKTK